MKQSPAGKDMNMEAEGFTMLRAVTKLRLVKTKKTGEIQCVL
jgi:hypothetical protein